MLIKTNTISDVLFGPLFLHWIWTAGSDQQPDLLLPQASLQLEHGTLHHRTGFSFCYSGPNQGLNQLTFTAACRGLVRF